MDESDFRTAQQLLELLRAKHGGCTNYRLAKILGMTHQGLGTVMLNRGTLSDENAVKLALELDLPPSYVIIFMHWQRAKDATTRAAWEDAATKVLKAGCFFVAGFLAHYLPLLSGMV